MSSLPLPNPLPVQPQVGFLPLFVAHRAHVRIRLFRGPGAAPRVHPDLRLRRGPLSFSLLLTGVSIARPLLEPPFPGFGGRGAHLRLRVPNRAMVIERVRGARHDTVRLVSRVPLGRTGMSHQNVREDILAQLQGKRIEMAAWRWWRRACVVVVAVICCAVVW